METIPCEAKKSPLGGKHECVVNFSSLKSFRALFSVYSANLLIIMDGLKNNRVYPFGFNRIPELRRVMQIAPTNFWVFSPGGARGGGGVSVGICIKRGEVLANGVQLL